MLVARKSNRQALKALLTAYFFAACFSIKAQVSSESEEPQWKSNQVWVGWELELEPMLFSRIIDRIDEPAMFESTDDGHGFAYHRKLIESLSNAEVDNFLEAQPGAFDLLPLELQNQLTEGLPALPKPQLILPNSPEVIAPESKTESTGLVLADGETPWTAEPRILTGNESSSGPQESDESPQPKLIVPGETPQDLPVEYRDFDIEASHLRHSGENRMHIIYERWKALPQRTKRRAISPESIPADQRALFFRQAIEDVHDHRVYVRIETKPENPARYDYLTRLSLHRDQDMIEATLSEPAQNPQAGIDDLIALARDVGLGTNPRRLTGEAADHLQQQLWTLHVHISTPGREITEEQFDLLKFLMIVDEAQAGFEPRVQFMDGLLRRRSSDRVELRFLVWSPQDTHDRYINLFKLTEPQSIEKMKALVLEQLNQKSLLALLSFFPESSLPYSLGRLFAEPEIQARILEINDQSPLDDRSLSQIADSYATQRNTGIAYFIDPDTEFHELIFPATYSYSQRPYAQSSTGFAIRMLSNLLKAELSETSKKALRENPSFLLASLLTPNSYPLIRQVFEGHEEELSERLNQVEAILSTKPPEDFKVMLEESFLDSLNARVLLPEPTQNESAALEIENQVREFVSRHIPEANIYESPGLLNLAVFQIPVDRVFADPKAQNFLASKAPIDFLAMAEAKGWVSNIQTEFERGRESRDQNQSLWSSFLTRPSSLDHLTNTQRKEWLEWLPIQRLASPNGETRLSLELLPVAIDKLILSPERSPERQLLLRAASITSVTYKQAIANTALVSDIIGLALDRASTSGLGAVQELAVVRLYGDPILGPHIPIESRILAAEAVIAHPKRTELALTFSENLFRAVLDPSAALDEDLKQRQTKLRQKIFTEGLTPLLPVAIQSLSASEVEARLEPLIELIENRAHLPIEHSAKDREEALAAAATAALFQALANNEELAQRIRPRIIESLELTLGERFAALLVAAESPDIREQLSAEAGEVYDRMNLHKDTGCVAELLRAAEHLK